MEPVEAAEALIAERFPECLVAFVAGSFFRGQATPTSDLDIVVITVGPRAPYRESIHAFGYPVELFVHDVESYKRYFQTDARNRHPSLPSMCVEGVAIRDHAGLEGRIKQEAAALLEAGPEPLSEAEVDSRRYAITDLLDDFSGSMWPEEDFFIAAELAAQTTDFLLAYNRRWSGRSKWLMRALRAFDASAGDRLTLALFAFSDHASKSELTQFAEDVLAPARRQIVRRLLSRRVKVGLATVGARVHQKPSRVMLRMHDRPRTDRRRLGDRTM